MSKNDTAQRLVTKVVQQRCSSDLHEEANRFGLVDSDGSAALVLVPKKRSFPLNFVIPAYVKCIVQKDGAHYDVWDAGRRFANYRHTVAYMVNLHSITYSYNVSSCPTRDNVMVEVDVSFVFDVADPKAFCYKLCVMHFDDLLRAVAEEAIRTLVRSIDLTAVNELRSACAQQLQKILNQTFEKFGVTFRSTTVKQAKLPPNIHRSLANASEIDSALAKQAEEHRLALKTVNTNAENELKNYAGKEANKMNNLIAKKERIKIETSKRTEEQRRLNEREIIKAEQVAETEVIGVQASYRDEQTKAQTRADKMIQEMTATDKNARRQIDQWKSEELMKSERDLSIAENDFKILKMQIESRESENMRGIREHEVALKRSEALKNLASSGSLIVSGKNGKSLLDQFAF